MDKIEIPLSKKKLALLLLGSLAFVACGTWFVVRPPAIDHPVFGNPAFIFIAGILSILFFGSCAVLIIRKLPDQRAGLILDADGFTDNSSGVAAGFVPWSDVETFSVTEVQRQKIILVHIKNSDSYISRQESILKQKAMKLNQKYYGTPLSITANGLAIGFDELHRLLNDHLSSFRKTRS